MAARLSARAAGMMLLDELVPSYDFNERHETVVHASPERVLAAIKEVLPHEIPLFSQLWAVRTLPARLRRRGQDQGEVAPDTPMLEQMLAHGFALLGEEPGREIVFGTIGRFWDVRSGFAPVVSTAEDYFAFDRPDYGRAVMNFRLEPVDPEGRAVRLSTETRVFIPDERARRKFSVYWRVAGPGSALIRRGWLRAIRRRAER